MSASVPPEPPAASGRAKGAGTAVPGNGPPDTPSSSAIGVGLWRAAAAVVGLLGAVLCLIEVRSKDLFWHLAVGREIVETGVVPFRDTFCAFTWGRDWLDVHWLAQVGMALLERVGGLFALQVAAALALLTALGIAARIAGAAAHARTLVPVALLALLVAQPSLLPRPSLAALLLPVVLLALLERIARPVPGSIARPAAESIAGPATGSGWREWASLALLGGVWANVHGSFVLGPVLAAAYALGAALEPVRRPAWPRLAGAAVLLLASSLVNPNGAALWQLFGPYVDAFAGRIGASDAVAPAIVEWLPPLSAEGRTHLRGAAGAYPILLLLAAIAPLLAWPRVPWARAFVLWGVAVLSLSALRHLGTFALLALAIVPGPLAAGLDRLGRTLGSRGAARAITAAALVVGLLLGGSVVTNRFFAQRGLHDRFGAGLARWDLPIGALDFVAALDPEGQVFHTYEIGGVYLWRLDRARRAFADGRIDLLAPEALPTYRQALVDPATFDRLAGRLEITHAIVRYATPAGLQVVTLLEARPGWRRVFVDATGAVYAREDVPLEPRRPAADPTHPVDRVARAWFDRLGPWQVRFPVERQNEMLFAWVTGDLDRAVRLGEEILEAFPDWTVTLAQLCQLYAARGEPAQAGGMLARLEQTAPEHHHTATCRALLSAASPR